MSPRLKGPEGLNYTPPPAAVPRGAPPRDEPHHPPARAHGGRPLRRLPALACALLAASASFAAAPDRGEATRQLAFGIRMAQAGSWREAAFRFGKAVQADAENAAAQNDLGVALESIGEYAKAAAAYAKALELEPSNGKIRENGDRLKAYLATRNDPKPAGATPPPPATPPAPPAAAPPDPNAGKGGTGGGAHGS